MLLRISSHYLSTILYQLMLIKLLLSHSLESAGEYFLYVSMLAPVLMLLNSNFKQYAVYNTYGAFQTLAASRMVAFLFFLLISFSLVLLVSNVFIFILALSVKSYDFWVDCLHASELRNGKPLFSFVYPIMLVASLAAFYIFKDYIPNVMVISIFLFIILSLSALSLSLRNLEFKIDIISPALLKSLELVIIFGVSAFAMSLTASVPRFAIDIYIGTEKLAVFGAFLYFSLAFNAMTLSIFQYRIKRYTELALESNVYIVALLVFTLSIIALCIATVFHQLIINIIFGNELVQYSKLLPAFFGFMVLFSLGIVFQQALIASSKAKELRSINYLMLLFALVSVWPFLFLGGFAGALAYFYIFYIVKLSLVYFCFKRGMNAKSANEYSV